MRSFLIFLFALVSSFAHCDPPDGEYVLVSRSFKESERMGNAQDADSAFVGTLVIRNGVIQKTFWEKDKPAKKTIFNGGISVVKEGLYQIQLSNHTTVNSMKGKTVQNQFSVTSDGDLEIINPSSPDSTFREVWRKKEKLSPGHPYRHRAFDCLSALGG